MSGQPFLPDPQIIHCLKTCYGIEVAALTFLPLGADPNASVYQVRSSNRLSWFVKLKRGHDVSVEIIELLHDAGIQQVIPPIKSLDGKSSCQLGDVTLIVYPFVEGQNGLDRPLSESQWRELGKALRQVHDIQVPPLLQSWIRRETWSSQWRDAVRSLLAGEIGLVDDLPGSKLVQCLHKNMQAICRLVDRAEELGNRIRTQPFQSVLCHSDIHAGNVLLGGNGMIYIVDWDDPIMAPRERDLMFIGGGVANVWNQPAEEALFYRGYGKIDVNPAILTYYRHERIVEDIAVYCQELLLATPGTKDRAVLYKQFADMFALKGVVDVAFRSDVT